jgi:hypothetical protein
MNKNKRSAASPLLWVLLLTAGIILVLIVVRGGTLDQFKEGREIKNQAQVDIGQVNSSTDSYNQGLQDVLNE